MIILGIDPGTTTVGYCLIEKEKGNIDILDFGVISTIPKIPITTKIQEIGKDIQALIKKFKPEKMVIEKIFFQNNSKTAIDVAQCRGVIMYEAAKNGVIVEEYTPLQVKKAITGNGKADKKQLQKAIQILFGLEKIPKFDDTSDAIGMAYMGALSHNFEKLL